MGSNNKPEKKPINTAIVPIMRVETDEITKGEITPPMKKIRRFKIFINFLM